MIKMKLIEVNNGHCQITYSSKNKHNQTIYFCLQQQNSTTIKLLRCTEDYEPSHEIKFNQDVEWELPTGDSKLENLAREYIAKGFFKHSSK